jgi:uridine kinase
MSFLVAVAGGSGSGKTTLAQALVEALAPGAGVLISEDWYYCDLAAAPDFDPAGYDFDDIAVRDHDLLVSHLAALKAGRPIVAPQYSFHRHRRETDGLAVEPAKVIVVEGAHVLCRDALAGLFDLRLYIEAPADLRFIRRLLRDRQDRGRTTESVVAQYLATVRPAHDRWTGPSIARADLVLNNDGAGLEQHPGPEDLGRLVALVLSHPGLQPFARALA